MGINQTRIKRKALEILRVISLFQKLRSKWMEGYWKVIKLQRKIEIRFKKCVRE